jgi:hypothetical protein
MTPPPPIRMYWFNRKPNFGDELSPVLCAALGGRPVRHTQDFGECELVAIGSVLHLVTDPDYGGVIWGSGFIKPPPTQSTFGRARITAVRGHLTRKLLGCPDDVPLGDPGLLAARFASPHPKRFAIGIVPHYVDMDEPIVHKVADKSDAIALIDPRSGVQNVIDSVAQCEGIVASCLHALILADSLGIPNAWIKLGDRVIGADFKFRDYYSVFGIDDPRPIRFSRWDDARSLTRKLRGYRRDGVEQIKQRLVDAFPFKQQSTDCAVPDSASA